MKPMPRRKRTRGKPACPACGSKQVQPIVYGLPGPELIERAERGEVALGGCIVFPENPEWQCALCLHAWR
jgi:hypothetical protein